MKKVLIITYYWPPAGGPGVQRWLKFVKYFKNFGIAPVVYIPENPNYPMLDDSFKKEIPSDVTIISKPIFEPYKLASVFSKKTAKTVSKGIISNKNQSFVEKLMLFIRGNFFIPDARKYWVKPSVKYLSKYLEENTIDTIITTGPPHSVHLIGLQLKEKIGVKWLADFRDPWTSIGYHDKLKLTTSSAAKHKALEQKVLQAANKIVVTSFTTKKEFEAICKTSIEVVTNGYDVSYFNKIEKDKLFTFAHIGSLLSGRNPKILWEVFKDLIAEIDGFKDDFKLCLAGAVSETIIKDIKNLGLEKYLQLPGYVSHEEALRLQRSSRILLLLEIDSVETQGIIPGKLFEYMAAENPIVAIGPNNWDAGKIVKDTNTGSYFTYQDKEALKTYILKAYQNFKQHTLKVHPIGLQQYSRKSLTEKMAQIIDKL
ncbi:glycosyltransferase family 4 protein [Zhouia sp. PK063]|uniref:glycosyltransferase family 4 protein n=1 Tax=Zhouia sp. PK063 TaxID=3373602 RepID=UPI0037A493AE